MSSQKTQVAHTPQVFKNFSFFNVALIAAVVILGIILLRYFSKQSKLKEINDAANTSKELRQISKSFLSTNDGRISASAAILDQATKDRPFVSTTLAVATAQFRAPNPTFESGGNHNFQGQFNTFTASSAENIVKYNAAKRAEEEFFTNKLQRLLFLLHDDDKDIRNRAELAIKQMHDNKSLGSCDQSCCPFPCAFDCGMGDCGVCTDVCGNGDSSCLPPAPAGWPERCGKGGDATCVVVASFLAGWTALCNSGITASELEVLCEGFEELPAAGVFCTIVTGVGDGVACAWTQDQTQQEMANAVGCTCSL